MFICDVCKVEVGSSFGSFSMADDFYLLVKGFLV